MQPFKHRHPCFTAGFTLIELLIVVAIIGILAAIAVPNFLNAQIRAKISRTQADMKAVSTALEQYFLDWNSYVEDHDYPSDVSQRGLFRLTSPMAYIASLPVDAFGSSTAKKLFRRQSHFRIRLRQRQYAEQTMAGAGVYPHFTRSRFVRGGQR